MARMTGRTLPVFNQAASRSDGHLSFGTTNNQPGLAFGPGVPDKFVAEARAELSSVGNRITSFVSGGGPLAALEQAWPDAAYWFHEALAEPLDTIAVPKLETAIEVLIRSENTKGSKARIEKVIRAFYGKAPSDLITPQSQTTVADFAKGFVRDRSRILHGTWSTLTHPLHGSRPELTDLTRALLILYTVTLDDYATSATPTDSIDELVAFANSKRMAAAIYPIT